MKLKIKDLQNILQELISEELTEYQSDGAASSEENKNTSTKTFQEIKNELDPDGTKHDLTLTCIKCKTTETCRCSKPKRKVEGICHTCSGQLRLEKLNKRRYPDVIKENSIQDPTKEEMMAFLKTQSGGDQGWEDEAEVAMYWFAAEYHGGQSSNLYSVLSTSPYSPGRMMSTVSDEGGMAEMFYDALVSQYAGDVKEGYGMGDMSKDPKKAFKGARWTVKYNENKIKLSEVKEIIKQIIRETLIVERQHDNHRSEYENTTPLYEAKGLTEKEKFIQIVKDSIRESLKKNKK